MISDRYGPLNANHSDRFRTKHENYNVERVENILLPGGEIYEAEIHSLCTV